MARWRGETRWLPASLWGSTKGHRGVTVKTEPSGCLAGLNGRGRHGLSHRPLPGPGPRQENGASPREVRCHRPSHPGQGVESCGSPPVEPARALQPLQLSLWPCGVWAVKFSELARDAAWHRAVRVPGRGWQGPPPAARAVPLGMGPLGSGFGGHDRRHGDPDARCANGDGERPWRAEALTPRPQARYHQTQALRRGWEDRLPLPGATLWSASCPAGDPGYSWNWPLGS